MALVVLAITLSLAMAGHSSGAQWCVCKGGIDDKALQTTLDYACGAGADCGPIHEKGGCYEPNTVKAHCSYAANSYFQRKGQATGSCDFSGSASITTTDPSTSGCVYPSSASAATTNTPPSSTSTTPSTTTPSTGTATPTTTGSPYTSTTPVGITGGTTGVNNNGFDTGMPDVSGLRLSTSPSIIFLTALLALALMMLC